MLSKWISVRSVLSGGISKMNRLSLLVSEELNSGWRWKVVSRLVYLQVS